MVVISTPLQRLSYALQHASRLTKLGWGLFMSACLLMMGSWSEWHQQQALQTALYKPVTMTNMQLKKIATKDISVEFFAILPKAKRADALSADILKTADSLGLRFERAEFGVTHHAQTRLVQHQIRLPVRGTYIQVRLLLNALLNAHPTLALTEMQIHRNDVLTDIVEADLLLSLYLQGDTTW